MHMDNFISSAAKKYSMDKMDPSFRQDSALTKPIRIPLPQAYNVGPPKETWGESS